MPPVTATSPSVAAGLEPGALPGATGPADDATSTPSDPGFVALLDAVERTAQADLRAKLVGRASGSSAVGGASGHAAGLAMLSGGRTLGAPFKAEDLHRQLAQAETKIAALRRTREELKVGLEGELGGIDQSIRSAEADVEARGRRVRDVRNSFWAFWRQDELRALNRELDNARQTLDQLRARRDQLQTRVSMAKNELASLESMEAVLSNAATRAAAANVEPATTPTPLADDVVRAQLMQQTEMLADALTGVRSEYLRAWADGLKTTVNEITAELRALTPPADMAAELPRIEARLAEVEKEIRAQRDTTAPLVETTERDLAAAEAHYGQRSPHEWDKRRAAWLKSMGPGVHTGPGEQRDVHVVGGYVGWAYWPVEDPWSLQTYREALVINHQGLKDLTALSGLVERHATARAEDDRAPATVLDLQGLTQGNVREQIAVLLEAMRTVHHASRDIAELRGELDVILGRIDGMVADAERFNRVAGWLLREAAQTVLTSAGLGPLSAWLARGVSWTQTLNEHGLSGAFEKAVGELVTGAVSRGIVDVTGSEELAQALLGVGRGLVEDKSVSDAMRDALLASALAGLSDAQRTVLRELLTGGAAIAPHRVDVVLDHPEMAVDELRQAARA